VRLIGPSGSSPVSEPGSRGGLKHRHFRGAAFLAAGTPFQAACAGPPVRPATLKGPPQGKALPHMDVQKLTVER
jgi:hypothetical protein